MTRHLRKFDEVQIQGLHPTNPVAGNRIEDVLQTFVLTRDVEGAFIPVDALHPRLAVTHPFVVHPIPMHQLVRLNWRLV